MDRRSLLAGLTLGALSASTAGTALGFALLGRAGPDPSGQYGRCLEAVDQDRRRAEVERDAWRREAVRHAAPGFATAPGRMPAPAPLPGDAPGDRLPPQTLPTRPGGE
jgi:hypothetical protein